MSLIAVYILIVTVLVASVSFSYAFRPTNPYIQTNDIHHNKENKQISRDRRGMLVMNVFGTQKLGQSVIGVTTSSESETSSGSMFRRSPLGSGTDERSSYDNNEKAMELHVTSLTKIGKSMKQYALLSELSQYNWSQVEKLNRINLATTVDGLLPSLSTDNAVVKPTNMHAGGLFDDWNDVF